MITTPRALEPACSPAAPSPSNMPGCASRAKLRDPPPRLCRVRGYTAWRGAVLRCHSRGASDSRGEAPALCVQPTLSCCDQDHNAYASSRAKLAGGGVLSRSAWSLNSCASEPSALLPPLERGFAKHTCCHAARDAVRRRTAWSRRWRTYCTTQSLPPQASSARSAQVARGPGLPDLQTSKRRV